MYRKFHDTVATAQTFFFFFLKKMYPWYLSKLVAKEAQFDAMPLEAI